MIAAPAPEGAAARFARAFSERFARHLGDQKRVARWKSMRASGLDDPCERRLYLWRTAGEQAAEPSDDLQAIFGEGRLHEAQVARLLDDLGWRLHREQREGETFGVSGHVEGYVDTGDGQHLLCEIKSASGYAFPRLHSEADLREARGSIAYTRRWYGQCQIYMLQEGQPEMILLVKSKQTGQVRPIPITLDYDYAERLLQKAERVEYAVARSEPPAFIEDAAECRRCAFFGRVCNPPTSAGEGARVIADSALIEAAAEWRETHDAADRFDAADKALKDACRNAPISIVGDLTVTTSTYETTRYDVPEEVKRPYARKVAATRVTIVPPAKANGAA